MAMNKNLIIKKGPFIRKSESDKTYRTRSHMRDVIIALLPLVAFAFYKNGVEPYQNGLTNLFGMIYPLLLIGVATLSGYLFELLYFKYAMKVQGFKRVIEKTNLSYALIPGLIIGLIVPPNTPIFVVVFAAFIGNIVTKMLFGGFGHNIFNPAGVGYLLAVSTYAKSIRDAGGYLNATEVDQVLGVTPLEHLANNGFIGTYQELVGQYGTLWDFFSGMIPGSVGETSALLITLGFGYLVIRKVISWKIPVIYIGTVFIMTWIIAIFLGESGLWYPTYSILSGGLFFGAVFMATEPVTSPTSVNGQIIYAVWLGVLTTVLRFLASTPEGVIASILVMNMLVIVLDRRAAISRSNGFNRKAIINLCIMSLVIIALIAFVVLRINNMDLEASLPLIGGWF